MLTKITLVLALCLQPKASDVTAKLNELRKNNPGAVVTLRIDKKAVCSNGQVIKRSNAEEKILAELK